MLKDNRTIVKGSKVTLEDLARMTARGFEEVGEKFKVVDKRIGELRNDMEEGFAGINKKFDEVDIRFNEVDRRFSEVDKRFDKVDKRFDEVDKRFGQVDRRFDRLESKVDYISVNYAKRRETGFV